MTAARTPHPNRWLIAVMCTVLQLCLGTVYAWSFFQPLLTQHYRWSNTGTSWAFSLAIFSLGIAAAWGGMNLGKYGPRKLAVAGGLLFGAGYLLASLALSIDSLALFCVGYGMVAGTGIGLGYVTPMSTVTKWFPDRIGLLTGQYTMMRVIFFFDIAAGISIVSFQSPLYQEIWKLRDIAFGMQGCRASLCSLCGDNDGFRVAEPAARPAAGRRPMSRRRETGADTCRAAPASC